MAKRFFKKIAPTTRVVVSPVKVIAFWTIDNLIGYHHTEDDSESAFFLQCMKEQRYGLSEITEAEYAEALAKKNSSTLPPSAIWQREEMGATGLRPSGLTVLGQSALLAATAIETQSDARPVATPSTVTVKREELPAPTLGKRK